MADIEAMFELDNQPTLNAEFDVEQVENIDVHFDVATGTSYHNQLLNRDLPNQHPITSITGLREELDSIKETATTNTEELTNLINQEQERAEQAEADLESDIQSKYTELFTAINEETYRATTKENILNGEITDTNAHIDSVENELTQDINTEKAERISADNYLQEQINQNADNFSNYNTKSEQYSIDNQQNIAINNEITNRENADRELQYQITVNLNKFANYRTSSAQDAIDSDIRSSIATEQNARELADLDLQNQITEEVERSSSSETNLQNQITSNTNNINTIKSYIPSQTSSTNQLADKNFVNSSISSNTAIFIGTFDSVEDLESYSGTLTVNDYAFVIAIDSDGNTVYNRYKWTGTQWLYEYSLNNSSFTAAQWAAINSTITEDLVNEYSLHVNNKSNPHNVTKSQIGLGNVDNTSDLNKPISTATQSALNNKQNVISDLQNIRDGASLGATSLQENSQIIIDMQNDINSNMGDIASINAEISNLVTIDSEQTITGEKTLTSPLFLKNGQGTGSLWIGGNVNSGNLSNNNRHLARISVPSFSDITKATTMLGFDSSGDNTLSVANNKYDTLSFGGQKKITNATSPMAIGFCVTQTRESTAATDKIIPLEMDANEVRFNVQPNYNGTNLATATDISSLQTSKQDKLTAGTGISIENNVISNTQTSAEWGNIQGTLSNQTDLQNALNGKANLNLGNSTAITNCITEIPQDIKLELNNGTLTVKAGAKFYLPDGKQYQISADTTVPAGGADVPYFILGKVTDGTYESLTRIQISSCYSGSTQPSFSGSGMWFDTANNVIKFSTDGGSTWVASGFSLPLAICTPQSSTWVSIDQVFNGFGYIGSTVFALPNVKGLIPNGRNADGTLKNVEFTVDKVVTSTFSGTANRTILVLSRAWIGESTKYSYDSDLNYIIYGGDKTNKQTVVMFGYCGLTSGVVSNFQTKLPFRAVDYNDLPSVIEQYAPMPTITYWE